VSRSLNSNASPLTACRYSKTFSIYSPRDSLYTRQVLPLLRCAKISLQSLTHRTSPCKSHRTARPAAPSPVQGINTNPCTMQKVSRMTVLTAELMFRFAQKVSASRVEPGGTGGCGGKSRLQRICRHGMQMTLVQFEKSF
jgi:hypothetical protein